MPMSAEARSERIEYHRIRPWNPAATKHIAATISASWMLVARMCMGTDVSSPSVSGYNAPMMFHSPYAVSRPPAMRMARFPWTAIHTPAPKATNRAV